MNKLKHSNTINVQVDNSHYITSSYCKPARFASYSYQLKEVLECGAQSVLEIGPGNGVVTFLLRQAGIKVDTVDFDETNRPDFVASVLKIPVMTSSYEAVLCCQVLEHLSWDMFLPAMSELARVTQKYIVLSVPDASLYYYLELAFPFIGRKRLSINMPSREQSMQSDEHFWELGHNVREDNLRAVFKEIGLNVKKSYRVKEFSYHRFFILSV